jgi:hypothetical protein
MPEHQHDAADPGREHHGHSDESGRSGSPPTWIDRRTLMRLALGGGALFAVPTLLPGRGAAARSPFDAPFGIDPTPPRATPRPARRSRRRTRLPLAIVSRAAWRADERIRRREIDFDDTVEKIVVHHTATGSSGTDWPREVRAIYRSTLARGYRDVPYHWLVDPDGVVYEGRWARDVRPGERPNGEDGRGRSVRGGHAKGHNPRTIGIALLGNFDDRRPTDAAIESLITLTAWRCARWGIDPLGATPYRLSNGTDEIIPNICPHRGVRATVCPGRAVVEALPELRSAAASRIAAFAD